MIVVRSEGTEPIYGNLLHVHTLIMKVQQEIKKTSLFVDAPKPKKYPKINLRR